MKNQKFIESITYSVQTLVVQCTTILYYLCYNNTHNTSAANACVYFLNGKSQPFGSKEIDITASFFCVSFFITTVFNVQLCGEEAGKVREEVEYIQVLGCVVVVGSNYNTNICSVAVGYLFQQQHRGQKLDQKAQLLFRNLGSFLEFF